MFTQEATSLSTLTGLDFGLCSFLFASRKRFSAVPDFESVMQTDEEAATQLSQFEFTSGSWFSFDDLVRDAVFSEEKKSSRSGPYFESRMEFILNGDDFEHRAKQLRAMKNAEHIVIAKAASGTWRAMGTKERGADFTFRYDTNKGVYECAFVWESVNECLYVNIDGSDMLYVDPDYVDTDYVE